MPSFGKYYRNWACILNSLLSFQKGVFTLSNKTKMTKLAIHLEFSHCSATSIISLLKLGKRFHIFLSLLKSNYFHSLMTDTNIKHPPTTRIAHQKPLVATWFKNDFLSNPSLQRGDNSNSALCAWHLSSNTRELTGKFAPSTLHPGPNGCTGRAWKHRWYYMTRKRAQSH